MLKIEDKIVFVYGMLQSGLYSNLDHTQVEY